MASAPRTCRVIANLPPVTSAALGVIAGTGFYALADLRDPEDITVETIYGPTRARVGTLHDRRTVFISRHGYDHSVPPHMVNYRANIQAMLDLGVTEILAVNVVGGVGTDAGDLVLVDDFIDFTKARPITFFDGSSPEGVVHVDMGEPYHPRLRAAWKQAADNLGVEVIDHGIYGAYEGPRFETKAEIRLAAAAGVTVVGMTGVPEVVLAVERDLPYASLCIVANPAAGQGSEPITIEDVNAVVAQGATTVTRVLSEAARILA
jgi:5'-deoxy-5'-methylthioadenosine phosphorylase